MAINPSFQSMIEGLVERIADAIAARTPLRGSPGLAPKRAAQPAGRSSGARPCPVPGCGKPGAGPRNRFFCRDHSASLSVTEQKKLLAQARGARGGAAPAKAKAGRTPKRKLDMRCRVAGCANLSRGPRFGFICDKHRKELSKAEQKAVREKYNARRAA